MILRSIIALAHDLGMEVVAEGAETDSDAVELYQLGCEYAQGLLLRRADERGGCQELLQDEAGRAKRSCPAQALVQSVRAGAVRPPNSPSRL